MIQKRALSKEVCTQFAIWRDSVVPIIVLIIVKRFVGNIFKLGVNNCVHSNFRVRRLCPAVGSEGQDISESVSA